MILDYTKLFLFSAGSLFIQTLFMFLGFYVSKTYIEKEKNKLKEESTHTDLGLILLFAIVVSTVIFFAGSLVVSAIAKYYFKNPEYLYRSFFELLEVFLALLLTSTVVFFKPKEHLRLKKITNNESQIVHKKFFRVTAVSIYIALFSYAAVNTFLGTKYSLICEYGAMAAIVIYCFLEMCGSKNVISKILLINKTTPPFNSEKLVAFLNHKFHYIVLACMIYAAELTNQVSFSDLSAFTHINNVYFFLLAVIAFQCLAVAVMNKLASYANSIKHRENSRQLIENRGKNIGWICDFTIFFMYFVAVCCGLKYAGVDVDTYVFNEYFLIIVIGSFIAIMLCRGFNEVRDRLLEKAEVGDKEHYKKLKTFAPTISTIFYVLVIATAVLIILANLNLNVVPIITSFSIVGAAFGLAAQDIIKSFLNGIVLLMEKNLYIGDYVDINDKSGTIEKLSLRTLYLRGIEGFLHTIPYSDITSITNHSKGRRVWSTVLQLVSFGDVEKASKILQEVIEEMKNDPEYKGKVFSDARIYGLEPFNLTGVKVKWEISTAPTLIHFLDDVYRRLAVKLKDAGVALPEASKNISVVVS